MSSMGGVWYLNAYCRFADASRLFRLARIFSATLTDEHFRERRFWTSHAEAVEDLRLPGEDRGSPTIAGVARVQQIF
jgi:predicted DNA-binding transcriptional regulator YafY